MSPLHADGSRNHKPITQLNDPRLSKLPIKRYPQPESFRHHIEVRNVEMFETVTKRISHSKSVSIFSTLLYQFYIPNYQT
jgi:hypothetical protein